MGQRPLETETLWLGAMVEECNAGKPEVRGRKSGLETLERSTEGHQVTGRKLGKTKMKNETAIFRESNFRGVLHFHEQCLTRLHLKSREKAGSRCLGVLLLQFLF